LSSGKNESDSDGDIYELYSPLPLGQCDNKKKQNKILLHRTRSQGEYSSLIALSLQLAFLLDDNAVNLANVNGPLPLTVGIGLQIANNKW
jgi:hypothetical protein